MKSGLQKIKLGLGPGGHEVEVDGVDVSDQVSRVSIDYAVGPGSVPVLYLEGRGEAAIEVEGVVVERTDDRQAVVEFLSDVDPVKLEEEAMGMLGLSSDGSVNTVPEAMLAVLKGWASGRS